MRISPNNPETKTVRLPQRLPEQTSSTPATATLGYEIYSEENMTSHIWQDLKVEPDASMLLREGHATWIFTTM